MSRPMGREMNEEVGERNSKDFKRAWLCQHSARGLGFNSPSMNIHSNNTTLSTILLFSIDLVVLYRMDLIDLTLFSMDLLTRISIP